MDYNIEKLLESLSKTKFRGSFHLNNKMKEYVKAKGIIKIENDAKEIIIKRLSSKYPLNDGRQTPMKQVHPVFIAQHATGCCCRGCLEKIHKIKKSKELNNKEINYIIRIIMLWIKKEIGEENDNKEITK